MTFGASSTKIAEQSGVGGNKFMWRMNLDDRIIGETFTKFIGGEGIKTIAILAENNDFGRGATDNYAKLLPASGIKVASTEFFTLGASDMRPQLSKIASEKPDALIFFGEAPECALLVRQRQELGLDIRLFTRGACATDEGLKAMGDPNLGRGLVEGSYWVRTPDQPMTEAYKVKYGEYPAYNAALAYYAMYTIDQAIKAGGASKAGIEAGLGKVDWKSAIGPIKFNDHHQAHPNLFLVKIDNAALDVFKVMPTE